MKKYVFCLLAAVLVLAGLATAQESRGTIQGTVKDPQGGVVANATVFVTNTDKGTSVNLKTNENGRFQALLLLPGNYSVTAESTGFKKAVREGIALLTADVRDVELVLQVGASTESVTVTTEAPLVDVTHTDNGIALDDRSVRDLPVMANSVTSMVQFAPGVNSGFSASQLLGPHSTQGGSDYNNGSGVGGNTWTIDGAFSNGNGRNTSLLPSVSSVSEVKVLDNTFDGSFGHTTGLGISVTTKSGSNEFHGDASENYWSQRWQGSNLFTKQAYFKNVDSLLAKGDTAGANAALALPIQPSGHSNMYGFTATGPFRIPKLVDFRNKVFWTLSYNGERDAKPETANSYAHVVPSATEKTGNFSDLLKVTSDGLNYQLYDPLSVKQDTTRTGTHYLRNPIPGNVLPASYIGMGAPVYKNYTKYWPDPNNSFDPTIAQNSGCPSSTNCNNADFMGTSTPYNWNFGQWAGRMDVNLTDKFRIFGRYTRNHMEEYRSDWTYFIVKGYNNSGANGSGVTRDDQNGVLDFIYTASPSTILHALGSVSNWMSYTTTLPYAFQFKPSDAGLPSYLDSYCGNWCYLPQMTVSGYSANGIGGTPGPQYNRFYDYNFDVYHTRGNHQLRAGANFRQQTRSIHNGNNDGGYTFGNTYFRQYDDGGPNGNYNPATLGLSWASFMTGLPTGASISNSASYMASNQFAAAFIQDTWRATPRFTLTLSLRSEWENGAKGSQNNYIVGWDPKATLPISSLVQAAYASNPLPELASSNFSVTGGPLYAGTPGAPDRAWKSELVWLPRIGFGYQIDKKTVLRGGYGLYYDTLDVNALVYGENQTGYSVNTGTTFTTTQGVNWGASGACGAWCNLSATNMVSPMTDPFPVRPTSNSTRFNVPVGNTYGNMGLLALANGPSSWTIPADKHPRMQRWRMGIERQLTQHDLVSVGYTGAWTDKMNVNINESGMPSKYWYFGNSRPVNTTNGALTIPGSSTPVAVGGTISCAAGALNPNNPGSAYGGTGCLEDTNMNGSVPINPFYINNLAALQSSNPTLYSALTSVGSFFTSQNIAKNTLLRQYPSSNLTLPNPIGKEAETEIDAVLNHRFSRGLVGNFSYTYFHSRFANSFFQGWYANDPDRPQSLFWQPNNIAPHVLSATWVYDLPFGKGRHFARSTVADLVAGGWTISGNYKWEMGTLLGMPNAFYYGDINNIKVANPTIGQWFNTAGCLLPGQALGPGDVAVPLGQPCTAGWEKRTAMQPGTYQARTMPLYADGIRNPNAGQLNVSLGRDFRFGKDHPVVFQVRGDVLNVMNHSFMGGINTGVTSGTGTFGAITSGSTVLNRFIQIQGHLRW